MAIATTQGNIKMSRLTNIFNKFSWAYKAASVILIMTVSTLALKVDYVGSIDDGLRAPTALAVGDEYIAVLEPVGKQIKIYTSDGVIYSTINIEDDASGLLGLSDQLYLFCDKAKKDVVGINITDGTIFSYLPSTDKFVNPIEIKKSGDNIYVLDAGTSSIYCFNTQTQLSSTFTIIDDQNKTISFAPSFAFDETAHRFYVLDQINSRIWVLDGGGKFIKKFVSFGGKDGQLTRGGTVLCDKEGNIFISDRYQGRILAFASDGEFLGSINLIDYTAKRLMIPIGMAIDKNRLLYVASRESDEIHIFRLPAKTGASQAYFTKQVMPNDLETVDPTKVKFMVEVEVVGDPKLVIGLDYEIYSGEESKTPIFSKNGIQPSVLSDWENGVVIVEWALEFDLAENAIYQWRTRIRTGDSTQDWTEIRTFYTSKVLPKDFELRQNYPNPFNPVTKIAFDIPKPTNVSLVIYNVLGQFTKELVNGPVEAGKHAAIWDGTGDNGRPAASGIYFYRLVSGEFSKSKKMILIR
jgi:outer membrane protein assembly factor BamB